MTSKPTISGFTFINHAIELDFPVVESIKSMLPICDELIVNIGIPDDGTIDLIKSIGDDKIKIIMTPWYPKKNMMGSWGNGRFANIALFSCSGDWVFFLQGDEVVHEDDLPKIEKAVAKYNDDLEIEGLALEYYHFYGGYRHYRTERRWVPEGVRVVRNGLNICADNVAQTFYFSKRRKMRYLNVALTNAHIYHYGHSRNPQSMKNKKLLTAKYWHSRQEIEKIKADIFDYHNVNPKYLAAFNGSHPEVMQEKISQCDWEINPSKCYYKPTLKDMFHDFEYFIERLLKNRVFGPHYHRTIRKQQY